MRRSRGSGSVCRVPADESKPLKYWQVALDFPSDDGRRHRRVERSRDYDTAVRKLAILQLQRAELAPPPPVPPDLPEPPPLIPSDSLSAWLRYWLHEIVDREVRPRTAEGYRNFVFRYVDPSIGSMKLTDVQPPHVRAFHQYMREAGLAEATVLQGHRVLAIALKQAHREGYTHRDVAALTKPPRKNKPQLQVLAPSGARAVLNACKGDRLESRWAAAILTGARQGELLGVELDRVSDVLDLSWQLQRLAWSHGCVGTCGHRRGTDCPDRKLICPADYESRHLTGGLWLTRPKSSAGSRRVPLVGDLRALVERRIEVAQKEPNPYGLLWTDAPVRKGADFELTGKPIDPSRDNKAWHALLERAGVEHVRLHDARHLAVDLLYEAGVAEVVAMEIIGHSSIAMTRRYRSRTPEGTMRHAMEQLADQLRNSGTIGSEGPHPVVS